MHLRRLSEPGPLLAYLDGMQKAGLEKEARQIAISVRNALSTPDGRELLQLLENALVGTPTPVLADPRALAAKNAQSFIAHDLTRILGAELDGLVEGTDAGAGKRDGRRR